AGGAGAPAVRPGGEARLSAAAPRGSAGAPVPPGVFLARRGPAGGPAELLGGPDGEPHLGEVGGGGEVAAGERAEAAQPVGERVRVDVERLRRVLQAAVALHPGA